VTSAADVLREANARGITLYIAENGNLRCMGRMTELDAMNERLVLHAKGIAAIIEEFCAAYSPEFLETAPPWLVR